MKILLKIALGIVLIYVLFWGGVAAYFSYADRYKTSVESHLTRVFDKPVSIGKLETVWRGFSPTIKVQNFRVAGDSPERDALAFESLSAVVSPSSLLNLWPSFTEFTIEKPVLEIVALDDNRLSVGGIVVGGKRRRGAVNQRVVSWLLDQQNGRWVDGQILWVPVQGQLNRYQDINIDFSRINEQRQLKASVVTPKGPLAFTAKTNGDLISDTQWDASLQVEGESGQQLLTPDEFSVVVKNGQGKLLLKTLDVEQIRDFIKLTGLAGEAGWLLDAELTGRLHDVNLDFSGPLLSINDWSLDASASDIGFKSIGRAPAMNNLQGELRATKDSGNFLFSTRDSEFSWSRWYQNSFPITQAMGEFSWQIGESGAINIAVENAEFEDANARISNVHAKISVNTGARKVSSFGDLFRVESVSELNYNETGELVSSPDSDSAQAPINIDAHAEFEVVDMSKLAGYIPNNPKLDNFRKWSSSAFLSGTVSDGVVTYKGEVSADAFANGKASLDATANYADVTVDYAPEQDWPPATRALGSATVKNELLTISPSEIWLNGDPLSDAQLQISKLFQRDRTLSVRGNTTTSLVKGMDFLFKGPLIKPENRSTELPIIPKKGWVDINTNVEMVLNDVVNTRVYGTAKVRDGYGELPEGVPVSDINASIDFTERKVESNNVRAVFLGGETRGKVVTVKEAQPPVVKLIASGAAKTEALQPWIGEHLLTWFNGVAPWQGSILFEGDRVEIEGQSNLDGVAVSAPAPLQKSSEESANLKLQMVFGGTSVEQSLSVIYNDTMSARFRSNLPKQSAAIGVAGVIATASNQAPSLFDNSMISIGGDVNADLKPGINFNTQYDNIDLDDWLSAIIDLASFEPQQVADNDDFLDSMRSINIESANPVLIGREFGPIKMSAVSVDGLHWIGTIDGENISGTMQMQPRAELSNYGFKLSRLVIGEDPNSGAQPEPIDYSLSPNDFPSISLSVDALRLAGKNLGSLSLSARPEADRWLVEDFTLTHNGIRTKASGDWVNNTQVGSITKIEFNTIIDEAEGAFNEMDFDGVIKRGNGTVTGMLRWIGAPHEFDYARLNGDFDAFIKDGELVQIEPGSGKLVGLLNFNAIARRLIFDFRDVFASGLKFDHMRYAGALADGEAILSEAFVLSPAAFIQMEGKVDLNRELVDLEVHVSPELGGNIALLSALANPAAGAFVFITQRIFKDEMRNANFKSYRARGTWEDFEMVDLNSDEAEGPELAQADIDQDSNQSTEAEPEAAEQAESTDDQSEALESDSQSNQSPSDLPPEN